jgi:hypothetical protein
MGRWRRNVRHITDGELHAWLDGALDLLPEGRGDEIREHLSTCSACRERMQDEEEIRDRSSEIMTGLQLRDLELPTFEELRERAAAPEPGAPVGGVMASGSRGGRPEEAFREERPARYRGPLKGIPLAWAATIALALGVGWMGGQVWKAPSQVMGPRGPGAAEPSTERLLEPSGDFLGDRMEVESGRALPAPEPLGGDAGAAAPEPRRVVEPGSLPPGRASGSGVQELPGIRSVEAVPSLRDMVLTSMAPTTDAAPWPPSLPREGERFPESSLAVPGLKVLSVDWEEWLPGERALHIRQLLSVGDTLELRYLGLLMGMEPHEEVRIAIKAEAQDAGVDRPLSPAVLEASLPPGWNQVEMRWGRGWLVARAPLPEASIKALLRSLR